MPDHRNTGFLGVLQNYNDTMSQLEAQREGGLDGLLDERNRLAVRDAHLDTADHLAALREQQERAERRARQEHQRQQRERERIAALPKCTDCESPVEGTPNRCPRCNEIGILASSQFHAAPQLRQWLSNPARWPVLHSLGITTDDITQLKTEAAALITTLRQTPAYKATRGIRNSMDFHEFIERGASKIDSLESSIQQTVEQKNPGPVRQYVDAHPHSDKQITGQLAAGAILVLVPLAIPAQYGWLGVLTLSSGLIGSLIALIAWNARVQLHWDTISREYHSKLDLEIADLQEKRALLMAGWPGMCFRLRELLTAAHQKSQENDSLRGQWVRLCENGSCSLPAHMVGNNTGPSPIADLLTQFLHLFHPETVPPPKQATTAERSAVTEDATASVVNILARSLIAVAVADGRIRAEEVATITNELIELGTEGYLARSAVKQCISELRGGTLPRDFIKAAIGVASKFKGTSFGQNILDMQRSVAQSDGGVSSNEHKVLDAFQRGLS